MTFSKRINFKINTLKSIILASGIFALALSAFAHADTARSLPKKSYHKALEDFKADLKSKPFNDSLYEQLKQFDHQKNDGRVYSLTKNNTLNSSWILQTPDAMGVSANNIKINQGIHIANRINTVIGSANSFVDITTLYPFPDGEFHSAIVKALKKLASSGKHIKVRIVAGLPPGFQIAPTFITGSASEIFPAQNYINTLIKELEPISNNNLEIYVGVQRKIVTGFLSWNHSKIIAVDGKQLIVGGQNFWNEDYLGKTPVNDLNVQIAGGAAFQAHKFADVVWESACGFIRPDLRPVYWKRGFSDTRYGCLAESLETAPNSTGNTSILGVGRTGEWPSLAAAVIGNPIFNTAGDFAFALALNASQSALYIAQQSLVLLGAGWHPAMEGIGAAIAGNQKVYIVVSGTNPSPAAYQGHVEKVAEKIKKSTTAKLPDMSEADINKLLCKNLHLAELRFGPSKNWPNGKDFANHSKFFMIDNKAFYVGSENLYAGNNLMEYGTFIDNASAVATMRSQYWDPLWNYSKAGAISGADMPDASKCLFLK